MFEKLLKQWANEQGFDGWSQDHAAVLYNLSKWLNMHAVEKQRALDEFCRCLTRNVTVDTNTNIENCRCCGKTRQ